MRATLARRTKMTASELDALEHIEADGPLTQRELGDRLVLTSGAVTMLVDRLEQAGWVRRTPHPTDRRSTVLGLTEQATDRAPQGLAQFHRAIEALAQATPGAQRHSVALFLEQAARAARRAAEALVE